jgi:beta-phosphoglucomutase
MKALIFDMDGTMVNNMHYHLLAWEQIIRERGGNLSGDALKKEMYGKNEEAIVRIFGEGRFSEAEIDDIATEKEVIYRNLYHPFIKPVDGLSRLIQRARSEGIVLGVGTASNKGNTDFVLGGLGLLDVFGAVICADEVLNSKPDPETFLKVAARLGIEPADCIVFEDVPKGVEAATRAGMRSVALTTTYPAAAFEAWTSVLAVISDFTEITIAKLRGY